MGVEVAVVGAVGVDTTVYLEDQPIDLSVETQFCEARDSVGQAGGYASRGFARLGHRVTLLGFVGDDPLGRHVRERLLWAGVDTSALMVDPQGTKRAVNLMYGGGRRKNFYDARGAMVLQPDLGLCRHVLRGVSLAHFNLPNWARQLLPLAREAGAVISCDLQDVTDLDDPYRRDFVAGADILFFSSVNFPDTRAAVEHYLALPGERLVVASRGERGCAVGSADGVQFFDPVDLPAPVLDANGAGDSLAVGLLSSHVLRGHALGDAVLRGQIAARHCCSLKADASALISRDQLDGYFEHMNQSVDDN